MRELTVLMLLILSTSSVSDPTLAQTPGGERRPPIIDMHLHAFRLTDGGPPRENPATGRPSTATTSAELRDASLAELARYNIVKAVTSGPAETVAEWRAAAPGRLLAGAFVDEDNPLPKLAALRADIRAGRVQILGELGPQYRGMAPNDLRLELCPGGF
jgi:hypothetical protein